MSANDRRRESAGKPTGGQFLPENRGRNVPSQSPQETQAPLGDEFGGRETELNSDIDRSYETYSVLVGGSSSLHNSPEVAAALQGIEDERIRKSMFDLNEEMVMEDNPNITITSNSKVGLGVTVFAHEGAQIEVNTTNILDKSTVLAEETSILNLQNCTVSGEAFLQSFGDGSILVRKCDIEDNAIVEVGYNLSRTRDAVVPREGAWFTATRERSNKSFVVSNTRFGGNARVRGSIFNGRGRCDVSENAVIDGAKIIAHPWKGWQIDHPSYTIYPSGKEPSVRVEGSARVEGTVKGESIYIGGTAFLPKEATITSGAHITKPEHVVVFTIPQTGERVTIFRQQIPFKSSSDYHVYIVPDAEVRDMYATFFSSIKASDVNFWQRPQMPSNRVVDRLRNAFKKYPYRVAYVGGENATGATKRAIDAIITEMYKDI